MITRVIVRGTARVYYGCSSEHTRAVILDIKEKYPHSRGIRTEGMIEIG